MHEFPNMEIGDHCAFDSEGLEATGIFIGFGPSDGQPVMLVDAECERGHNGDNIEELCEASELVHNLVDSCTRARFWNLWLRHTNYVKILTPVGPDKVMLQRTLAYRKEKVNA